MSEGRVLVVGTSMTDAIVDGGRIVSMDVA
jgi:hypothetical protein